MSSEDNLTQKTETLVDRWTNCIEAVEIQKSHLSRAKTDLANATNMLGKFLMPADAKDGEVFSIWHGAKMIEVSLPLVTQHIMGDGQSSEVPGREYKVQYRKGERKYP